MFNAQVKALRGWLSMMKTSSKQKMEHPYLILFSASLHTDGFAAQKAKWLTLSLAAVFAESLPHSLA